MWFRRVQVERPKINSLWICTYIIVTNKIHVHYFWFVIIAANWCIIESSLSLSTTLVIIILKIIEKEPEIILRIIIYFV